MSRIEVEPRKTDAKGPDVLAFNRNVVSLVSGGVMYRTYAQHRIEEVDIAIIDGAVDFNGHHLVPLDAEAAETFVAEVLAAQTEQRRESDALEMARLADQTPTSSEAFSEDIGAPRRWQYATVDTGAFNTSARLADVLGRAGHLGWELVQVYDKSSNWFSGIEKGFMHLRREVPPGVEPLSWSVRLIA